MQLRLIGVAVEFANPWKECRKSTTGAGRVMEQSGTRVFSSGSTILLHVP